MKFRNDAPENQRATLRELTEAIEQVISRAPPAWRCRQRVLREQRSDACYIQIFTSIRLPNGHHDDK